MDEGPKLTPLEALAEHVRGALGDKIDDHKIAYGELTFVARGETILEVIRFLRDDSQCGFISIVDICGVDFPEREQRFDVVYHFLSPTRNLRVRVKVPADDIVPVPSLTAIFPGADWYEREAYDLYGILFSDHPDLRRLLTDYGFDGHPMRKDFPTTGYVEVRYDEERKRVVYEPVKLQQEYRTFDYLSPWEGTDYVLPGDEKKS
ncbi:MAG: NADH-quinone oxidoreductase subunit C [Devosia sp.]